MPRVAGVFKCLDVIVARIPAARFSRMGVLVDQPDEVRKDGPVNWDLSVVGFFFGSNPPAISVVQQLVDSQWRTRARIEVKKISNYFIFYCLHDKDVQALIELHTTVIDGRILTLRRGHRDIVRREINFDIARI